MRAVFVILGFVACFAGAYASLVDSSCIAISTTKIIKTLCYTKENNKANQTLIDDFFGCYDHAPGKPQFVKCQEGAFGGALNTVEKVGVSCKPYNQVKLPGYGLCLKREFNAAELDMNAAVTTLNACQSKVLGIPPSSLYICQ